VNKNAFKKIAAGNCTRDLDLSVDELIALLDLSAEVKRAPREFRATLAGQYIGILFEKPSLRTRLTFELAIQQLGGGAVNSTGPIGEREPVKDVARNMDRWTQCVVARTFEQRTIDELVRWSSVPIINALSNLYHPCQAMADIFTLREHFGDLGGLKLAFIGDGNNVAHSLMLTAPRLGMNVTVGSPQGYGPKDDIRAEAEKLAAESGARVDVTNDPVEAVTGAQAVYTDVWTSMGFEREAGQRRIDFQPFQVNPGLLTHAPAEAVFMHCLPARRGEETVDEVIESESSVVFDQAENRLHTQKALLLMLLG